MAKETKTPKKTWLSPAEQAKVEKEAQSVYERDQLSWFERSEHKAIRTCVCLCGHTFQSQARDLYCTAIRVVKDKEGRVILDKKTGKAKLKRVDVRRRLSKISCPKCSSVWIHSFE